MFICELCGKCTKLGEQMCKIVKRSRPKTYVNWNEEGNRIKSEGSEIVEELMVCQECGKRTEVVQETQIKKGKI